MSGRIAIAGAGMTGLTAARALADAGQAVTVFDKGRGLGGRLATRRTEWGPIDHGAPGVPAELADLPGTRVWPDGPIGAQVVGVPGMSSLLKPLRDLVDVLREVTVGALVPDGPGWALSDPDGGPLGSFDAVILAIPAPQVAKLLPASLPDMGHAVAQAHMDPLWTLVLVLPEGAGPPQDAPLPLAAPLGQAIPQSAKPGAAGPGGRWAVHADPAWSAAHVDLPKDEAAARMLAAFRAQTGTTAQPLLAAGHRWRYARVCRPLGQPFAASPCGRVLAGGDWALGPLATHAAASGRAMAAAVLAALA